MECTALFPGDAGICCSFREKAILPDFKNPYCKLSR
jgi:hypothetical protein